MNFPKLFQSVRQKNALTSLLWRGDNPYFEKEFKVALKENLGAEIKSFSVPKSGLDSEMIEASQGGFLFSPLVALFLKFSGSIAAWKTEAQRHLKEAIERADGQQLMVILMVPSDKRLKWDGLGCREAVAVEEISDSERRQWVAHMNEKSRAQLDDVRLDFVTQLEGDLLQLEKYVELWALGGDSWAEAQLDWNGRSERAGNTVEGSAFEWVDCIFQRKIKNSVLLVKQLMESGEDPIKLLGLLSKSARILALIEMNKDLSSQPPFLIQKLKKFKGQSGRLLSLCREADLHLKSTSVNGKAVMQRMGS